jgi:hypothetical protein
MSQWRFETTTISDDRNEELEQPEPRLRQRLRPRHARAGRLALASGLEWSGEAPEESYCPPAGGMQPASKYESTVGLERSAPTPAPDVYGADSHTATPERRPQDLLLYSSLHPRPDATADAYRQRQITCGREILRKLKIRAQLHPTTAVDSMYRQKKIELGRAKFERARARIASADSLRGKDTQT